MTTFSALQRITVFATPSQAKMIRKPHHPIPRRGPSSPLSSSRYMGIAITSGMMVFLVHQLGQYRGFSMDPMSVLPLLLTSSTTQSQSQQVQTIPVPVPHVPKEVNGRVRSKYEKPLMRAQVHADAVGRVKNREINPQAVGSDIARLIAHNLGKAHAIPMAESYADPAAIEEPINVAEQRRNVDPDGFSSNFDNAKEGDQTTLLDPNMISRGEFDQSYQAHFDRLSAEDNRDDDGPTEQNPQAGQYTGAVTPIDLGTPPENLPKFKGSLPSDWNTILRLREAFMEEHYPSPKPPQLNYGSRGNVQVRLPPQLPPYLQTLGQLPPQGQTLGQVGLNNGKPIILLRTDALYQKGTWDKSPIIIEKYKLVFFTVPKVGCTAFKQLFRRMMGYANWKDHQYYNEPFLPHNPLTNGLKYLSDYPFDVANDMLTSPQWTRAIFVRQPEERVLSAYLDKAALSQGYYIRMRCCDKVAMGSFEWNLLQCGTGTKRYTPPAPGEINRPIMSFQQFLENIIPKCSDPHWEPQAMRMAPKYWDRINFVGRFENIYEDTKRLLTELGAWDKYGASGWDVDGKDGAMFDPRQKAKHGTAARDTASKSEYLTAEALAMINSYYDMDYTHPKLQLARPYL